MITNGENWHYVTIKSLSRLLKSLDATHKGSYYFCINCLIGFRTASARNKHNDYCGSNDHIKIYMLSEKKKWLKLREGQYQFKILLMLYAKFESILRQVDEQYREKMNQIKTEREVKTPYSEKTNMHIPSGLCVHSAYEGAEKRHELENRRQEITVITRVYIEKQPKKLQPEISNTRLHTHSVSQIKWLYFYQGVRKTINKIDIRVILVFRL